jgi:hypothetical protein
MEPRGIQRPASILASRIYVNEFVLSTISAPHLGPHSRSHGGAHVLQVELGIRSLPGAVLQLLSPSQAGIGSLGSLILGYARCARSPGATNMPPTVLVESSVTELSFTHGHYR